MSASSVCVTCGMLTQEAWRRGPEIFLMRESGTVSIGPNLAKSTCGTAGSAPPAAGATAPLESAAFRSSRVMRPFSPVPLMRFRSRPSSRASRRTAGPANTPEKSGRAGPAEALAGRGGRSRGATGEVSGASAASSSSFASASSSWSAEICPACPPASSFATSEPIDTLSPTLTTISVILPAAGDGTSMLALSDSSVTIGCSASTVSPAFTRTSMTGTSVKSPMSGIVMSIVAALAGAGDAPDLAGGAGSAAFEDAGAGAAGATASPGRRRPLRGPFPPARSCHPQNQCAR